MADSLTKNNLKQQSLLSKYLKNAKSQLSAEELITRNSELTILQSITSNIKNDYSMVYDDFEELLTTRNGYYENLITATLANYFLNNLTSNAEQYEIVKGTLVDIDISDASTPLASNINEVKTGLTTLNSFISETDDPTTEIVISDAVKPLLEKLKPVGASIKNTADKIKTNLGYPNLEINNGKVSGIPHVYNFKADRVKGTYKFYQKKPDSDPVDYTDLDESKMIENTTATNKTEADYFVDIDMEITTKIKVEDGGTNSSYKIHSFDDAKEKGLFTNVVDGTIKFEIYNDFFIPNGGKIKKVKLGNNIESAEGSVHNLTFVGDARKVFFEGTFKNLNFIFNTEKPVITFGAYCSFDNVNFYFNAGSFPDIVVYGNTLTQYLKRENKTIQVGDEEPKTFVGIAFEKLTWYQYSNKDETVLFPCKNFSYKKENIYENTLKNAIDDKYNYYENVEINIDYAAIPDEVPETEDDSKTCSEGEKIQWAKCPVLKSSSNEGDFLIDATQFGSDLKIYYSGSNNSYTTNLSKCRYKQTTPFDGLEAITLTRLNSEDLDDENNNTNETTTENNLNNSSNKNPQADRKNKNSIVNSLPENFQTIYYMYRVSDKLTNIDSITTEEQLKTTINTANNDLYKLETLLESLADNLKEKSTIIVNALNSAAQSFQYLESQRKILDTNYNTDFGGSGIINDISQLPSITQTMLSGTTEIDVSTLSANLSSSVASAKSDVREAIVGLTQSISLLDDIIDNYDSLFDPYSNYFLTIDSILSYTEQAIKSLNSLDEVNGYSTIKISGIRNYSVWKNNIKQYTNDDYYNLARLYIGQELGLNSISNLTDSYENIYLLNFVDTALMNSRKKNLFINNTSTTKVFEYEEYLFNSYSLKISDECGYESIPTNITNTVNDISELNYINISEILLNNQDLFDNQISNYLKLAITKYLFNNNFNAYSLIDKAQILNNLLEKANNNFKLMYLKYIFKLVIQEIIKISENKNSILYGKTEYLNNIIFDISDIRAALIRYQVVWLFRNALADINLNYKIMRAIHPEMFDYLINQSTITIKEVILENDLTFTDKILEKIRNLWNNLTGGING